MTPGGKGVPNSIMEGPENLCRDEPMFVTGYFGFLK